METWLNIQFSLSLFVWLPSQHLWACRDGTLIPWASLTKWLTMSALCTYFRLLLTTTLLESAEGRMIAIVVISWSIPTKVWDPARIELATPGSVVRHVSAVWTYNRLHYVPLWLAFLFSDYNCFVAKNNVMSDLFNLSEVDFWILRFVRKYKF